MLVFVRVINWFLISGKIQILTDSFHVRDGNQSTVTFQLNRFINYFIQAGKKIPKKSKKKQYKNHFDIWFDSKIDWQPKMKIDFILISIKFY